MSYPAACRAYARYLSKLLELIKSMKERGINLEDIIVSIDSEKVEVTLDLIAKRREFINGDELLIALKKAADDWKGFYENMKEEEIEWKRF